MVFISLIIVIGNILLIDWQLYCNVSKRNFEKERIKNPTIVKPDVERLFS